jgi:hypothetical protein
MDVLRHGGYCLDDRELGEQRVASHRLSRAGIGETSPDVDNQFAVGIDGDSEAGLTALDGAPHGFREAVSPFHPSAFAPQVIRWPLDPANAIKRPSLGCSFMGSVDPGQMVPWRTYADLSPSVCCPIVSP